MKKRAGEVVEQQCGLLVSNDALSISQKAVPLHTNTLTHACVHLRFHQGPKPSDKKRREKKLKSHHIRNAGFACLWPQTNKLGVCMRSRRVRDTF